MARIDNLNYKRITIFRFDEHRFDWIYKELHKGRLHQSWGGSGMSLMPNGYLVDKEKWEEIYRKVMKEDPTPKRYTILKRMTELTDGEIVIVPKMPKSDCFTVAIVSGGYEYDTGTYDDSRIWLRHIVQVDSNSVTTFPNDANYLTSVLSSFTKKPKPGDAVEHCTEDEAINAAALLLKKGECERNSVIDPKS